MTAPRLQERVRAPAELAQCAQWVAWRFVTRRTRRGDTRQDKVPFNVASGRAASHSTPADWTSYAAATQACGYAGVGFVFSPDDPYAGVDLDGCRDPETGITAPWAQQIIDDAQTYAEISPSGTGVKLFGRGTLARSLSKKWGDHLGIEAYDRARYFCFTGQHLAGTPHTLGDIQATLDQLTCICAPPTPAPRPIQPVTLRRTPPRGQDAARSNARAVIAQFNAEHPIEDLLQHYGATRTPHGWACNCGVQHSHTTQLQVLSGNTIVSYSDQCRWAPHFRSHTATDAFRLYTIVEHDGNCVAALKVIHPLAPRAQRLAPALPDGVLSREEQQRRDAANAERRIQRQHDNRSVLEHLEAHISLLELPDRAHALAAYLITRAQDAGFLQVRPTNAQICAALPHLGERTIQRAFHDLASAGVGVRRGGRGGLDRPNEPATWTFNRAAVPRVTARTDAPVEFVCSAPPVTLDKLACDHDLHDSEHVSGVPPAAPASVPAGPVELVADNEQAASYVPEADWTLHDTLAPERQWTKPIRPSQMAEQRRATDAPESSLQRMMPPHASALDADDAPPPRPSLVLGMRHSTWRTAYRTSLESMSASALNGERMKQQCGVAKAERNGLPWLKQARVRLELVYAEMQRRRAAHAPAPPHRRRTPAQTPPALVQGDVFAGVAVADGAALTRSSGWSGAVAGIAT